MKKWHFFLNFISHHIFAIHVGGASLWLPTACRLITVSGARLPSADGLVYKKCTTMLNLPSQYVCNLFQTCLRYISVYQHTEAPLLCLCLQKAPSSGIYVNWITVTLIPAWISNYIDIKCGMNYLSIPKPQRLPLKFGNWMSNFK